jgi:hypothetical protein
VEAFGGVALPPHLLSGKEIRGISHPFACLLRSMILRLSFGYWALKEEIYL